MKRSIFDIVADQEEAIRKEAFIAPLAAGVGRLALGVGKAVAARPFAAMGAALTASDIASGTKRFSNITKANRANPFRPPSVG